MGRKRTKGKMPPSDESLEITEPTCQHVRKGLEQGILKKTLLNVNWDICQDCQTVNKEKHNSEEEETGESYSIWLCLKCGHRGCDRNSEAQHALKHYTTPRSESHCLVLNLGNWSVWCYVCDNEVPYSSSNRLGQLVDYIKKQALAETSSTVSKEQESKDFENKKLEKDCKNEQEKEKYGTGKAEKEASLLQCSAKMMVKGLSNLGNTCFFNAVLQNLYQTTILRELLKEKMTGTTVQVEPLDLPLTEPLVVSLERTPGPLTAAMCQFLTEMQETKGATVTPKELFSQICKKAVRFKGYQQQDSQELLRYLLDGMRAEEIQRISVGIVKTLKDSAMKMEEEELKKKVKEYERKRAVPNFVDRIFGGELTSTIMCEECRSVSLVHESFLDLSLPVLDDQDGRKNTAQKSTITHFEKKSEEDEGAYTKEKTDTLTAPSKHLQKKAKKQAKKHAKNQRHQQKIQDKLLPLNDFCQNHKIPQEEIQPETENMQQETESLNKDELGINQTDFNNKENVINALGEEENGKSSEQEIEDKFSTDNTLESLFSATEEDDRFNNSYHKDNSDEEKDLVNAINELNLQSALEPSDDLVSIFDSQTSGTKLFEMVNENTDTAFSTLAERKEIKTSDCSVQNCLYQFTQNEKLSETNKLLCSVCTRRLPNGPKENERGEKKHIYTSAIKQMLISLPPPVLTLHLKRFQQAGFNLRKITKHVQFPEVLDLAPFCALKCKGVAEGETQVLYSLYGIVEHNGTMRSGHYTAYVKVRTSNASLSDLIVHEIMPPGSGTEPLKGQWFHISDTHVQAVPTTKVLSSQAYLLFYERIL